MYPGLTSVHNIIYPFSTRSASTISPLYSLHYSLLAVVYPTDVVNQLQLSLYCSLH